MRTSTTGQRWRLPGPRHPHGRTNQRGRRAGPPRPPSPAHIHRHGTSRPPRIIFGGTDRYAFARQVRVRPPRRPGRQSPRSTTTCARRRQAANASTTAAVAPTASSLLSLCRLPPPPAPSTQQVTRGDPPLPRGRDVLKDGKASLRRKPVLPLPAEQTWPGMA